MNTEQVSRALVPLPTHERKVQRGFWRKVRRTLGRVPFMDQAIGAYFAAFDPATPLHAKGILMAALAYFILPADVIPDFLAGFGFSDDATVLLIAIQALAPNLRDQHVQRAREFLEKDGPAAASV
jgi:uncharacterized membrane protein YkvA (DUF1232 family)